ncbi:MAG TPA: hypothetical protein VK531_08120 [Gemmatimonadales bacterium]|nr:hypothetical protein [Gemmatimonadales bacterium]
MKHIALATCAKLPTLNHDDPLLIGALAELGLGSLPALWDAPDVCWDDVQAVLVRSCWDYHHRLEEFLAWVALLRWNSHEGYLRDLAPRGVSTVPTRWLVRGARVAAVRAAVSGA